MNTVIAIFDAARSSVIAGNRGDGKAARSRSIGRTLLQRYGFRARVLRLHGVSYSWNVVKQGLRASEVV